VRAVSWDAREGAVATNVRGEALLLVRPKKNRAASERRARARPGRAPRPSSLSASHRALSPGSPPPCPPLSRVHRGEGLAEVDARGGERVLALRARRARGGALAVEGAARLLKERPEVADFARELRGAALRGDDAPPVLRAEGAEVGQLVARARLRSALLRLRRRDIRRGRAKARPRARRPPRGRAPCAASPRRREREGGTRWCPRPRRGGTAARRARERCRRPRSRRRRRGCRAVTWESASRDLRRGRAEARRASGAPRRAGR